MSDSDIEIVPQGPGAVLFRDGEWQSWLVSLDLEYLNMAPEGATRAQLTLTAVDFDARDSKLSVSIELTLADLVALIGVASAIHSAAREDGDG